MVWYGDFDSIKSKKTIKKILLKELKATGIKFKGNTVIFKVKDKYDMFTVCPLVADKFEEAGEKIKAFY